MDKNKKSTTVYYINSVITLVLFACGFFLPEVAGLSRLGMQAIGIFFGFLWGWSTVGMIWPSIAGLVAISLTGFMGVNDVFGVAFGSSLTLQIFSMMLIIAFMEISGLSPWIARKIMSFKTVQGRPWGLTLLIMIVALLISSLTAGTTGILIAWEIIYPILKLCQYTRNDAYTNCVIFGIGIGGMSGAICFPYQPQSIIFIQAFETATGDSVNALTFFLSRFPISLLIVVAFWAVMRFIIRPDISHLKEKAIEIAEMTDSSQITLSTTGKVAAVAITLFLLGQFIPGCMPATWPWVAFLKNLGVVGLATIVIVVLSIVHLSNKDGYKPVMNIQQLIQKMNWNLIFIMSVTVPMTSMLESEDAKVFDLFINLLTPLTENLGVFGFIVVVIVFCGLLTQISHNSILAAVITPIIIPLASAIGVDPLAMVLATMMPIQIAVATPAASGNAAMIWGNTEWNTNRWNLALSLITMLVVMILSVASIPWFMLLFN